MPARPPLSAPRQPPRFVFRVPLRPVLPPCPLPLRPVRLFLPRSSAPCRYASSSACRTTPRPSPPATCCSSSRPTLRGVFPSELPLQQRDAPPHLTRNRSSVSAQHIENSLPRVPENVDDGLLEQLDLSLGRLILHYADAESSPPWVISLDIPKRN